MPDERAHELAQRLRKAEEAASYMERLETLASEAPTLREQVSLLQRIEQRENHRKEAIENARLALSLAAEAQGELPDLIASAANLVNQMARALREVDTFRREATSALSVVDRMDYEDELDRAMEEHEEDEDNPMQRDAQSIRMLIASRHGSTRVRRMIDDLSPGFEVFAGCNLNADPMRGELTTLIMAKLAAEAEASRGPSPATRRPAPPPPQMTEPAVPVTQESGDPAAS